MIVNSTAHLPNLGCQATSDGLSRLLRASGFEDLDRLPIGYGARHFPAAAASRRERRLRGRLFQLRRAVSAALGPLAERAPHPDPLGSNTWKIESTARSLGWPVPVSHGPPWLDARVRAALADPPARRRALEVARRLGRRRARHNLPRRWNTRCSGESP